MKNLKLLVFLAITTLWYACGNQSKNNTQKTTDQEESAIEVEPKIVFENDYAKVLKVSLAPGESTNSHQGDKRIIYSLTNYTIDWKENGKDAGSKTWKKGDVHYHEADHHSATNNGKTKAEWLVFMKKNADLPGCGENEVENDVNSVSEDYTDVLLDNDDFKLTTVSLPQGANIAKHAGINRVIYSLSDYQIVYETENNGKSEKLFKTGDVHWHEACQHSLQNNGATDAKFLVVSYKKHKN